MIKKIVLDYASGSSINDLDGFFERLNLNRRMINYTIEYFMNSEGNLSIVREKKIEVKPNDCWVLRTHESYDELMNKIANFIDNNIDTLQDEDGDLFITIHYEEKKKSKISISLKCNKNLKEELANIVRPFLGARALPYFLK